MINQRRNYFPFTDGVYSRNTLSVCNVLAFTCYIFFSLLLFVFGLILLNELEEMKKGADYGAVFSPVSQEIDKSKSEDGDLRKPIVIAWANNERTIVCFTTALRFTVY